MWSRFCGTCSNWTSPRSLSILIAAAAVLAVVSPSWLVAFQDAEKLAAAKQVYETGMAESKAQFVQACRDEVIRLTEKKDIKAASRCQDELKIFEERGILFGRAELQKALLKYGETRKKLGDTLAEVYTATANAEFKAGKTDESDKLRRELAGLGLPGKLNSIKLFGTTGYVMHGDYKGLVKPVGDAGLHLNSTFELVNGLAESGYLSIRSVNCPNHYFNHGAFRIQLSPYQDNDGFRQNATFKRVKGVGKPTGVSFEAVNFPRHYIRAWKGELFLEKETSEIKRPTPKDRAFFADATFAVVEPLAKIW